METLKRRLANAFWFTLALVFLFESWLWDHVKEWLRALGRLVGVDRFEAQLAAFIERLSPTATLGVFIVPAVLILPLKIVAVEMIAHGHILSGVAVIFAAKTLALGVTAFLFDHCKPKLLQIGWFVRFYSVMLKIRDWAHRLVEPVRQKLRVAIAASKALLRATLGEGRSDFARKLAHVRALIAIARGERRKQ